MKMYMVIHKLNLEGISMDGAAELINKHSVLEFAMKLYLGKTHRSVLDRNRSDVNEIENEFSIVNTKMQSANQTVVKKEMIDLLVKRMNIMWEDFLEWHKIVMCF